jgi:cholesterol oxidase
MSTTLTSRGVPVPVFPPLFGVRRPLSCPVPVRMPLTAGDGAELQIHHIAGGTRGPLILAPGTAMSALCYLTDTTEQSFAEFLAAEGFDLWLFDWRTSPYLAAHERGYTFDDVARCD